MKAPCLVAALCLLPLAFSSCTKRSRVVVTTHTSSVPNTLLTGDFINKTGTYTYSDSGGSSKLDLTGGGTLINWSFEITRPLPGGGSSGGTSGGSISPDDAGDPWFVYVETPQRLWFFDGTKGLDYSLHDGSGGRGGPAIFEGKLQYSEHRVPDELIRKLPADLQKLFPPVLPAVPRPSI
jgi:hypothetical protein